MSEPFKLPIAVIQQLASNPKRDDLKLLTSPHGEIVEYEGEPPTDEELAELVNYPHKETNKTESKKVELSTINPQDKKEAGRPCEYCKRPEEINKISTDYLQSAREARKSKKPFIPYLQELADIIGCDSDRISIWAEKKKDDGELEHSTFHGIIKSVNNIKELMLLQRTTGRFNPTGAIFQLKTKHGYIETEKRLLGGDKNAEPLEIRIVEEVKQKYE